jgi:ssDNA thymidine ADP-ribosyltransferase, DarT
MTIDEIVQRRGIKEVLHFTTNRGLVGILHSGNLKSRSRLERDKQLEFIVQKNATLRKDKAWLDYVNLSISRINKQFFGVSAGRWHRDQDLWWCILAFSPSILSHEGVNFTTTNNIYTGVRRGIGPDALAAMFADAVVRWSGEVVHRPPDMPREFTTCEQAEVLYPGEIPISFLQRIYVATEEDSDEVYGQLKGLMQPDIEIVISPEKFNEAQY